MAIPFRALITGISGFTGRHLANRLASAGWQVFGLTKVQQTGETRTLVADLSETDRIAEWIGAVRPTHIVHLAALSHVVGPSLPFYEVNALGTESLLKAIEQSGVRLDKVLIASSSNVYGKVTATSIREDHPVQPVNHYGVSKAAMELIARQWFEKFPIIITRPFNYTGPGQTGAFLFPKLASGFFDQLPMLALGNTHIARDLSDVSFVVEAYYRLLVSKAHSEILNICSGRSITIDEALIVLRDLTGHDPKIAIDASLVRPNEIVTLTGDPRKLQELIGPLEPVPPRAIFAQILENLARTTK